MNRYVSVKRSFTFRFVLLILCCVLVASITFFGNSDDEDSDEADEGENKEQETTTPDKPRPTMPPLIEPHESVCQVNGGNLNSNKFYKDNPDFLVVYYDNAGNAPYVEDNSIVYRYQNSTIQAKFEFKSTFEKQKEYKHRLFPRTFTNFVLMLQSFESSHSQGHLQQSSETGDTVGFFFWKKKPVWPSDYESDYRKYKYTDLGHLNLIPLMHLHNETKEQFSGFYNTHDCREHYDLDSRFCDNGTYCRTADPATPERTDVALCTYDLAMNKTVAIERHLEYEAAYGVMQCNYYVRVANSSNGKYAKTAVFHNGRQTICFDHPAEWDHIYVYRYRNNYKDYECKFLFDHIPPELTTKQPHAVLLNETLFENDSLFCKIGSVPTWIVAAIYIFDAFLTGLLIYIVLSLHCFDKTKKKPGQVKPEETKSLPEMNASVGHVSADSAEIIPNAT